MDLDDSLPGYVNTPQAMLRYERATLFGGPDGDLAHRKSQTHGREGPARAVRAFSERGALLNQLKLQLADLKENALQAETAAQMAAEKIAVPSLKRRKARRPLRENSPRERIVYPVPAI